MPKVPAPRPVPTRSPVQELYHHLDHCHHGNLYMSWYGQLRAEGKDHPSALEGTITHFGLRDKDWYKSRHNLTTTPEVPSSC